MNKLFAYLNSNYNIFKVSGKDCYDLLNRISTNNLKKMVKGESRSTLLLDEKGHIVDRLMIYCLSSREALILSNQSGKMVSWVNKFIFRDEVHFEKLNYKIIQFLNPSFVKNEIKSRMLAFMSADNFTFGIFLEKNYKDFINDSKPFIVSDSGYKDYRIKFLLPDFPNEFSADYNPLEIGLIRDISFTKGCYIGQEVIARLESQNKIFKYLVRIQSKQNLIFGKKYLVKNVDGVVKGILTTVGDFDFHLAVLHKSLIDSNTPIYVQSGSETIKANVREALTTQTYLSV